MKWPVHGSNPQYIYEALNLPMPHQTIDFSTNINPLGPPSNLKEKWAELLPLITDYPDPHALSMTKSLAEKEGVIPSQLLIGNGGAEIISLIGRLLAGKRALIIQPAFAEYEEACRVNGCAVEYFQLQANEWKLNEDELASKLAQMDALFITNPQNPTGVYFAREQIIHLLQACCDNDCYLIVDEAFYDFVSTYEPIVALINEYPRLLIVRSMTKMFAIAGLRLGYLIANARIIQELKSYQPHWSINAIALKAGEWCLDEEEFIEKTRTLIDEERAKLFSFYQQNDFNVSPSQTNFYLLQDGLKDDQRPLFQFLLEKGMIPRHTMNFRGCEGNWLRFAIKSPKENRQLMEAMAEWRGN
ncbi:threonine-phosphate decarboxylase CobD [Cytobacillus purgationiresistens]|uniref:threonine-phosphate decarboxylase n=1 Tax=Cytobacillus purgationiresistens TaxID=863449 RepID=A0ABU0APM7_9BACI|nr:threonine-phosphate decarboxylase CobD [Cytobacillus purgationiresistens]MDQ0273239.1 threonine-phosphate decarboxylase [Cytobacillus purgationiresistens]